MEKICRNLAVTMVLFLILLFIFENANADPFMPETFFTGGNIYKDLDYRGWVQCHDACLNEPNCDGWTYVKPGLLLPGSKVQGPNCLLMKNFGGEPIYTSNECCISGTTTRPCIELSFISPSPIPSVVIGGDYNYKIQTSGGYKTVELCPVAIDPEGSPGFKCDNSPGQRFSMPPGLTMDKSGKIFGQVKCWNSSKPYSCAGYQSIIVKAWDSCPNPSLTHIITKEFFIDVKAKP
jgi:hypothetical protein